MAAAAETTPPVRFAQLGVAEGLSQSAVLTIFQDSRGFIWLGTEDGLNRFDGYQVTVYKHKPSDPDSIPNDHVWSIQEDRSGGLWIGTEGGGVARWDRKTDRFAAYRNDPKDDRSLGSDLVRVVAASRDGSLWVGTLNQGVDRLDTGTGSFTHYRHDPADSTSLSSNRVFSLLETRSGQIWVGTDEGLNRFDPARGTFRRYLHDPKDGGSLSESRVRSLFEDNEGSLWIGTYGGGLNRLRPGAHRFERWQKKDADPSTLRHDSVRAVLEDNEGRLWVGTGGGLGMLGRGSGGFAHYRHTPGDPGSLADDTILSLYQDRGGVLWVGTRVGGAHRFNPATWSFGHRAANPLHPAGLRNPNVTSFAETESGTLWIGTFGGGVNVLDPGTGVMTQLAHDPAKVSSLSDNRVMALLVLRDGGVWVGTMDGGLNRWDSSTRSFKRYQHDESRSDSLSANGVMSLYEDERGNLWIGTFRGGLNRFDPATGSFEHFRHDPANAQSLGSDIVTSIAGDPSGRLWVGTDGGGLYRFDPQGGGFRRIAARTTPESPALASDSIFSLYRDPAGTLWVGTQGGGLDRLDWPHGPEAAPRVRNYSEPDGLANDVVYGILPDDAGQLWLSTNRGLTRFDPRTETFKNYDIRDGLQGREFNFGAYFRAASGKLFFGGTNGYNAFLPRQLQILTRPPAVVLTSVMKLNRPLSFAAPVHQLSSLELGFRDDVITFEFAALDYAAPERNLYRHQLEGFDTDWVDAGTTHRVTYTNLDPGDYVFRVRAANKDGVWGEHGVDVAVSVEPPPWRTWWAYAGYTLLGGIFVLALVQGHAQQVERQAEVRRQREVAESEARYRAVVEDQTELICRFDRSGQLLFVNGAYCRYYDETREGLLGKSVLRPVSGEDREKLDRHLASAGAEQPVATTELRARDGKGRLRWQQWTTRAILDAGGQVQELQSVVQDVTERKRATEERQRIESHLREMHKMKSLELLAGGVAHDFNNMLTGIIGNTDLARLRLPPGSPALANLDRVEASAARAAHLADQMLAYSGRGRFVSEAIELSRMVREMEPLLQASISKKSLVRYDLAADLPPVLASASQMRQLVMNLVTNGAEALVDGNGRIVVRTGEMNADRDYLARTYLDEGRPAGRYVFFEVSDNGVGIDSETLEKIFDPFFTTKFPGRGLGLPVVLGIVRGHDGAIRVDSHPGEGTVIRVLFPAASPADLSEAPSASFPAAVSPLNGRTVLVVDDEDGVREVARMALEGEGYRVLMASNGLEGVSLFREHANEIGVVLLDLKMPEMNGGEALLSIRRLKPRAPVILTSGYSEEQALQDITGEPVAGFMKKPFRPGDLLSKVRGIVG